MLLAGAGVVLVTERELPPQMETLLLLAVGSLFDAPHIQRRNSSQ
jgi:hypothetical protein